MSLCTVTLSANAGIALQFGPLRMWVDALHTEPVPGFSSVTPTLWQAMQHDPHFSMPDLLFYTHCHPDHYSRALTQEALGLYPMAELALPQEEFPGQILLSGQEHRLDLRGVQIRFRKLTHEGELYVNIPHYGCLLEENGTRILLPGDCAIANPQLADFAAGGPIDLLAVDFPWVTLRKGREFIEQVLRPRRLLIYHLPFPENDPLGYRKLAARDAGEFQGIGEVRLLDNPLQTECFNL